MRRNHMMIAKGKRYFIVGLISIAAVSGCQRQVQQKPAEMEAALEQPGAVLENEIPEGILIAYQAEDEALGETAQLIQEVTGGSLLDVQGESQDLEPYGTVFLGFVEQDGELPETVAAFLETNDMDNKTLIPFFQGEQNGTEAYRQQILEITPNIELLDACRLDTERLEDEVRTWLSDMGYHE